MNGTSLKKWLIASVVLNLFMVCGIAGGAWRWFATERTAVQAGAATQAQPRGLRHAADDLAPEKRQAYRLALREVRQEVAVSIQAAREGRQEVIKLLTAPQFDRGSALAALARVREAEFTSRSRYEATVIDFASTLSPADRQLLAAGFARRSTSAPAPPTQEAR